MSNHIADANKMVSDTPMTDGLLTAMLDVYGYVHQGNCPQQWVNYARELERELNAANSEVDRLRKANLQLREGAEEQKLRIKRLEEAGDALANHHLLVVTTYDKAKTHVSDWNKAKEEKL